MEGEYYIIKMEKFNMKEIGLMIQLKGLENILMKMEIIIQMNGKMVQKMGKGKCVYQMELSYLMEILLIIRRN